MGLTPTVLFAARACAYIGGITLSSDATTMLDTPLAQVPTLSLTQQASDPQGFADQLGASFRRFGFAIVADHGIPDALIARAWAETKALFELPEEEKRRYHVPGGGGARGYTPFKTEIAKDATAVDL